LENIQVSYDGRNIKIQQGEIIRLSNIENTGHYFPSYGEFDGYQKNSNYPNLLMPQIEQKKKILREKKREKDNGWFLF